MALLVSLCFEMVPDECSFELVVSCFLRTPTVPHSEKIRVIDECTIGGFNRTTGTRERLRLHAIDELAAYVCWTLTHVGGLSTSDWLGKTYDLTSAYKQFGICEADRNLLCILTLNHQTGSPVPLGANSVLVGAAGSVSSFLRVSLAISYLVCGSPCTRVVLDSIL